MSLLSQPGGIVAMFPGGSVGMFGPRGFTRMPEVAAILDPYEVGDPYADLVAFADLPRAEAVRLLKLLPANQADVAASDAPTFAELLAATRRCDCALHRGAGRAALNPESLEVPEHLLVARWV